MPIAIKGKHARRKRARRQRRDDANISRGKERKKFPGLQMEKWSPSKVERIQNMLKRREKKAAK